ncbi:hypothetical protein PRK78_005611 [Emydomyces testavorans]|uniref:CUE domain-containing protein n=1 Tax=Emydomyces testavorans TaxID=2070801 RepID=A0AAF0DMG6_9EURO|nr:hypothetical protein PRK78_005611 [Emydomyces testavorans]
MPEFKLPPLVPVPPPSVQDLIPSEEWAACLSAWITSVDFRLRISDGDFEMLAPTDTQAKSFLSSYFSCSTSLIGPNANVLRRVCFLLGRRLLLMGNHVLEGFLDWRFIGDFCKAYTSTVALKALLGDIWRRASKALTSNIEKGKSDVMRRVSRKPSEAETDVLADLRSLSSLALSLPEAGYILMTGSDYIDTMFEVYQAQGSEILQNAIVANIYVALSSLMALDPPAVSLLLDQLFSLKATAKVGVEDPSEEPNLLSDLICCTNLLKRMEHIFSAGSETRAKNLISSLRSYRILCHRMHPFRQRSSKRNKGKQRAIKADHLGQPHIHRMSLVTQIQDVFPNLGSGYVIKLLDYYSDDVETIISHLLEDSLPVPLKTLENPDTLHVQEIVPGTSRPIPSPPTTFIGSNVLDNNEFDDLTISPSKLHFGRANAHLTADDLLADRSGHSLNKAAIMSALAAFDSDDDERDDTYDIADVGGTIDSLPPGRDIDPDTEASQRIHGELGQGTERILFNLYKSNPDLFKRDAATRRSQQRISLRKNTGMTDESIEGWAVMLSRDSKRMANMERDYVRPGFSDIGQPDLPSTSYSSPFSKDRGGENDVDNSKVEETRVRDNGAPSSDGRGGSSRGRGGRGGVSDRGNAGVYGPSRNHDATLTRRRKDANKASRANHNRRNQRAKKLARVGL